MICSNGKYFYSTLRHNPNPCGCSACATCEFYDALACIEEQSHIIQFELENGFINYRDAVERSVEYVEVA